MGPSSFPQDQLHTTGKGVAGHPGAWREWFVGSVNGGRTGSSQARFVVRFYLLGHPARSPSRASGREPPPDSFGQSPTMARRTSSYFFDLPPTGKRRPLPCLANKKTILSCVDSSRDVVWPICPSVSLHVGILADPPSCVRRCAHMGGSGGGSLPYCGRVSTATWQQAGQGGAGNHRA